MKMLKKLYWKVYISLSYWVHWYDLDELSILDFICEQRPRQCDNPSPEIHGI